MKPPLTAGHMAALTAGSHRPEVQERIREAIRSGLVRVIPAPGGGIRVVPVHRHAGDPDEVLSEAYLAGA